MREIVYKILLLTTVFLKNPREFYDRVTTALQVRFELLSSRDSLFQYHPQSWSEVVENLEMCLGRVSWI
ncbi:MAG: hypothetical protein KatS3mg054_1391 [Chloroflexus sp.]|nr:MAG: hypothetical protein KatS3mg054_1391 [Chloroflexus sp.]